ncbi:MAG: 3-deoxy-manno-octulosonate cytidylyltransferase [Alphaproteobacteria bacterium]
MSVQIIIPARMAASRLPGKPMADIHGQPMIVHVWRRAVEADLGPVAVATDDETIAGAIGDVGGTAIMTGTHHVNGSGRIHEALQRLPGTPDIILNLQGDLPNLTPSAAKAALRPLANEAVAIGTVAVEITDAHERTDPHVVKVVGTPSGERLLRALYFTRATAPAGDGPLYHHIGLYAYRREALERYVALAPTPLERREKLEQLRALESGMRIDVALVDEVPLGVDTPADLERARALLAP